VGLTANIVQHVGLRLSRIIVDRPALIVLRNGTKTLQSEEGEWVFHEGEAIAIAGRQIFDVTNQLSDSGSYEAQWLVWDPAVISRFECQQPSGTSAKGPASLGRLEGEFSSAFDRALNAISDAQGIPDNVAQHRVAELLVWLASRGIRFCSEPDPSLSSKLRRSFDAEISGHWPITRAADHLAMSEATLRRRLAAEGTTFSAVLSDARLCAALMMLQSTTYPVNRVALEVGYESPSRFAIRFRQRFGFPPSALKALRKGTP